MEKYDVVIIGGGLGSLTTAAYLSKRLRNVAVFEEGSRKKLQKLIIHYPISMRIQVSYL